MRNLWPGPCSAHLEILRRASPAQDDGEWCDRHAEESVARLRGLHSFALDFPRLKAGGYSLSACYARVSCFGFRRRIYSRRMSYQALARKYRPQTFEDVIG